MIAHVIFITAENVALNNGNPVFIVRNIDFEFLAEAIKVASEPILIIGIDEIDPRILSSGPLTVVVSSSSGKSLALEQVTTAYSGKMNREKIAALRQLEFFDDITKLVFLVKSRSSGKRLLAKLRKAMGTRCYECDPSIRVIAGVP